MYAAQITQNSNAWDVFSMEGEHAGGLSTDASWAVNWRNAPMVMLMLLIIGCGYLGQQASNHFDDICDWHRADLVLAADILPATAAVALVLSLEASG